MKKIILLATSLTSAVGVAATVSGLQTFTPGSVISSTQMNNNFTIIKNAIESTTALTYLGVYDASPGTDPAGSPTPGDYYVISASGTIGATTYFIGDWIVWNGTNFERVPNQAQWTNNSNNLSYSLGDIQIDQKLKFKDSASNFVMLKAPTSVSATYTLTLPATVGSANQVLKTDGTGNLSWTPLSDASVQAFAKTTLPTCATNEVLKANGTSFSCVTTFSGTASRAVATDATGNLTSSSTTSTELGYLSGVTSSIQTQINSKENTIAAGTTTQFWRGDKNWANLNSAILGQTLSGMAADPSTMTAADSVLSGMGKMLFVQSNYFPKSGGNITGAVTMTNSLSFSGGGYISVPTPINMTDAASKSYVDALVTKGSGFVGVGSSGYTNTGANTAFFGTGAGGSNTTGGGNSFIGANAGGMNTTGGSNTYVGALTGYMTSVGTRNTGVGSGALQSSGNKDYNTALGASALYMATTGGYNTAVGSDAGYNTTTGEKNVYVGTGAGGSAANTGNIAVGFQSVVNGNYNITIGSEAGYNVTGNGNVLIGGKLSGLSSLSDTIILATGGNGTYGTERLRVDSSGNVGIGTTAPSTKLEVMGTITTTTLTQTSDQRYKKEIRRVSNALEKILAIDGVSYKFKSEEYPEKSFSNRRQLGVIAQTVEKVFPEAVSKDKNGFMSVAYSMLISPIIEAMREMDTKTKHLEAENKMLKSYLCQKDPDAPFCE